MKDLLQKKKLWYILGGVFVLLLVVFVGFGFYFQSHFYFHSTINGVNSSGSSVVAMQKKLSKRANDYSLTIVDGDDKEQVLKAQDLGLEVSIEADEIQEILDKQQGFLWVKYLFAGKDYMNDDLIHCDEKKLAKAVAGLDCMKRKDVIETKDANVSYKDGEFKITEEVYGTELDAKDFTKQVLATVLHLQETLDLVEDKCYVQPNYTKDSKEVKALIKTLNKYTDVKITYQAGSETEVIPSETIGSWLSGNDKMEPTFDKEAMEDYISSLRPKFDTYGLPKTLATQYGVTLTVPGGNYGWRIDKEGEVEQLIKDISAGEDVTRDFVYQYAAASREGNDYGNSYVEINRTAQHLYLIIDGAVVLETNCVTGNPNNGHETPTGAYRITYCEKNATLRGPGYATPVAYWMPFNGDIGLHDATWQSSFGGTRYKDGYGSHGCVNLPLSAAGSIFGYVQEGFPVLMYDLPGTETLDTATQQAVDQCKMAIAFIGDVSEQSGEAIGAARTIYESLSNSGKEYVDNYQALVDAEAKYQKILDKAAAKEKEKAKGVEKLINAIGDVTLDSGNAINEAEKAYQKLPDTTKSMVSNYDKLKKAKKAYKKLQSQSDSEG